MGVINPARNSLGLQNHDYVRIDFASDAVYRFKGWDDSPGARLENALAEYLELDVYDNVR